MYFKFFIVMLFGKLLMVLGGMIWGSLFTLEGFVITHWTVFYSNLGLLSLFGGSEEGEDRGFFLFRVGSL
jgi:hypothetical protein